eukprot:gene9531-12838_t
MKKVIPVHQNNLSNNSLFIGDLSKFCTEQDIEGLFSAFGQVIDVKIKRNNSTGKTLSYGFITFAHDAAANAALKSLDGTMFFGRKLRVRWAMYNARPSNSSSEPIINSVYVRYFTPKLSAYVTEEDLHSVFDVFGSVMDVSIKESNVDKRAMRQCGYGFVHFANDAAGIESAFKAVAAIDNATIDEVTYSVEPSKNLLKQFQASSSVQGIPSIGLGDSTMHSHGMKINHPQSSQQNHLDTTYTIRNDFNNNLYPNFQTTNNELTRNIFENRFQPTTQQQVPPLLLNNKMKNMNQYVQNKDFHRMEPSVNHNTNQFSSLSAHSKSFQPSMSQTIPTNYMPDNFPQQLINKPMKSPNTALPSGAFSSVFATSDLSQFNDNGYYNPVALPSNFRDDALKFNPPDIRTDNTNDLMNKMEILNLNNSPIKRTVEKSYFQHNFAVNNNYNSFQEQQYNSGSQFRVQPSSQPPQLALRQISQNLQVNDSVSPSFSGLLSGYDGNIFNPTDNNNIKNNTNNIHQNSSSNYFDFGGLEDKTYSNSSFPSSLSQSGKLSDTQYRSSPIWNFNENSSSEMFEDAISRSNVAVPLHPQQQNLKISTIARSTDNNNNNNNAPLQFLGSTSVDSLDLTQHEDYSYSASNKSSTISSILFQEDGNAHSNFSRNSSLTSRQISEHNANFSRNSSLTSRQVSEQCRLNLTDFDSLNSAWDNE